MHVQLLHWTARSGWHAEVAPAGRADLVVYFGDRDALRDGSRYQELRTRFPAAHLIGCSATATILDTQLEERCIVAAAVSFAAASVRAVQQAGLTMENAGERGEALGRALPRQGLVGVFVLADGMGINGNTLLDGLRRGLPPGCPVAGGMASDPTDYTETLAGADAPPSPGVAAALGFYGPNLHLAQDSACGWDAFGPRRRITRAAGNVLYELDGEPAYHLYRRYLGDESGIGAGVVFPLLISNPDDPGQCFVRAMLGMDPPSGAMTFAGDMPENWTARLMRGNMDRLALGAAEAARHVRSSLPAKLLGDSLALMVSCTGRLLLMGQRTIQELDFAADELGAGVRRIGFYAYGEIGPKSGIAQLHNQSMTITVLAETES